LGFYPQRNQAALIEVALIAIARKVVIVDVNDYSPDTLLAIAAIVFSLAGAY
jgi:uncharacterized membrane protein (DUF373 family)